MSNFSMFAGDSKTIAGTVTNDAGTPVNITGATIQWKAARSVNDEAVIEKSSPSSGVAIAVGSGGTFTVTLDEADTDELSGLYYHEAEMVLATNTTTVMTGQFLVIKTLIRAE